MNTRDIVVKLPADVDLEWIYAQHKKMFYKFMELEGIPDWKAYNFSIDTAADQSIFKDVLQIRFIEELTEATTAGTVLDHFEEEIIDSFNFFLSSLVALDKELSDFPAWKDRRRNKLKLWWILRFRRNKLDAETYKVIEKVGLLTNLLKSRPWAQNQLLVDSLLFQRRLTDLWNQFNHYINWLGIDLATLYKLWYQKSEINYFRLKTGY